RSRCTPPDLLIERLLERNHLRTIPADGACEQADPAHRRLLRARGERPRRRPDEQRGELAPPHSITSSASASSAGGIARPSAFAVLRLMISSNLVGAITGRSAGFSPLRIRPV